ncbi:hypothetical protein [Craterilacuibacter sp. RT1T]|uniref:hypothetical protein n=1 Tax=Craterilacuibacter sp. RT1T TaxID=2942211 RepID=UPI0020BECDE4|nr:hypothetical protein [Craterilacuibacter sp. RT1T]MCL6263661.1 hypothetical protein [Craterilacuibacter sp. RT1T]
MANVVDVSLKALPKISVDISSDSDIIVIATSVVSVKVVLIIFFNSVYISSLLVMNSALILGYSAVPVIRNKPRAAVFILSAAEKNATWSSVLVMLNMIGVLSVYRLMAIDDIKNGDDSAMQLSISFILSLGFLINFLLFICAIDKIAEIVLAIPCIAIALPMSLGECTVANMSGIVDPLAIMFIMVSLDICSVP